VLLCLNALSLTKANSFVISFCEPTIDAIEIIDPTDCGTNDGAIEINASGGNGNFEYTIDGGVSWQVENIFSNIPAGAYGVGVRNDDETCPFFYPTPIELLGPDSPRFIEVASTDPTNCGVNDGSITITAEGGTGPYFYSVDGGLSWGSSNVISNLSPGSYTAVVKNADDTCPTTYVFPIQLNGPSAPQLSAVDFSNPTDCGINDGTISVSSIPEFGVLYSIDGGSSWQESGIFTGLIFGEYSIQIQYDDNTCLVNGTDITLEEPVPPVIDNVEVSNPLDCGASNGYIIINASSGTDSYHYSIDNGISWQAYKFFTDLPAGTYNVQVRNGNVTCQVAGEVVVLSDPPAPEFASADLVNPGDCGATDGSIIVNASGGIGSYEYSIDFGLTWQTENTFINLTSGSYKISIRNEDRSCEVSSGLLELEDPPQPEILAVGSESPTDCELENGVITITAAGGTGSYQFSIDSGMNWQEENFFLNLSEGSYFIMVRNLDTTCPVLGEEEVLVAPVPPEIQSISATNPTDCGGADGKVIILTAENSVSLEYSIDGGFYWQSSEVFSLLMAGEYEVWVRNADLTCDPVNGGMINLYDPPTPEYLSVEFTNPSDCDGMDGRIIIWAQGGFGALQYSIDNGLNWQPDNLFENLSLGDYSISIRNQDGSCMVEEGGITLFEPPAPVIELIEFSDPSDCGAMDGMISISVTQGTGAFDFSIDGGDSWQSNNVFTNLEGGTYKIWVSNSDGTCQITTESILLNTPIPPEIIDINSSNPTDCGIDDGVLKIIVSEDFGFFEFSIDGGNFWQQSNEFIGLPADSYTVMVRNQNGTCLVEGDVIQLSNPPVPEVSSTQSTDPTDCGLENGTILISALNGAEMEYSIDGGVNWQASGVFPDLAGGTYQVSIKNGENCFPVLGAEIVLITPAKPEVAEIESSDVTDCGAQDGSIFITVEGTGSFEFSIDGGAGWQASNSFSGLSSGLYDISVRNDDSSCQVEAGSITLDEPVLPTLSSIEPSNPTDCGASNGTITVIGQGNDALEYSIDGGQNWQMNNVFESLMAGTYQVKIRNISGTCEMGGESIQLSEPELPLINNVGSSNPTDCGAQDGTIQINASGGSGAYAFSIDGGNSWQPEPLFQNLPEGLYEVIIINNDGTCGFVSYGQSIELTDPIAPELLSIEPLNPSDCGLEDGFITAQVSGGIQSYQYQLTFPGGGTLEQSGNTFLNLSEGIYFLSVSNDDGTCQNSFENQIELESPVAAEIVDVIVNEPSDCGILDASITFITSPVSANLEYSIDGGISWQASNQFLNLAPGFFDLKIRNSSGNCEVSWEDLTEIEGLEFPVLSIESTNPSDCNINDGTIFIGSESDENDLIYSINGGLDWSDNNYFTGLAPGVYDLVVQNNSGLCFVDANDVLLESPVAPEFNFYFENPSDCGIEDGSIEIEVYEGTGWYEYSIDGGNEWQYESLFDNLGPGWYEIKARNADGTCQVGALNAIELISPVMPVIEGVLYSNPTTCGVADGEIEIFINSEEGDFEYSIDNGNTWHNTYSFPSLIEGEFFVIVRNADGTCQTDAEVINLTEPEAPLIEEIIAINPTGCETEDGQVYIFIEDGVYQFSIDGGVSWQEEGAFQNLSASLFHIMVKLDDGSCLADAGTIQLSAPEQPEIDQIQVENPSGCGINDGSILISVISTTDDLEYSIDNGETWVTENAFYNLSIGTYNVLIRDENGTCQISGGGIGLSAPQIPIVEEVEVIQPSDCGVNDGQIIIYFTQLGNSFKYSLDAGATWQAENIFQNLSPGIYSLWISNEGGSCPIEWGSVELVEPEIPVVEAIIPTHLTDCVQEDGAIQIIMIEDGDFEYSIDGGVNWQTAPVFTNLTQGVYAVQVRNHSGTCPTELVAAEILNPLQEITFGFLGSDPTNCGAHDGKIELMIEGSSGPFEYSINGGVSWQPNPFFSDLSAGSYDAVIRNAGGNCLGEVGTIILLGQEAPFIDSIVQQNPSDCNLEDGVIKITALGGLGNYQYSINGGQSWQDSGLFNNLPQGNYSISIRNADGTCEVEESNLFQLGSQTSPVIDDIEITPVSDCNLTDGAIYFLPESGDSYEYSIDNGVSWQSSPNFETLEESIYFLMVRNADGSCTLNFGSVEISSPQKPEFETFTTPVSNCWGNDGTLLIVPANAQSIYEYSIDNGLTWTTAPFFDQLQQGEIKLLYRNLDGTCEYIARAVIIDGPTEPQVMDVVIKNPENCEGTDGSILILLSDTEGVNEFSIDSGITWSLSNAFENLLSGTYYIQVRNVDGTCEVTYQNLVTLVTLEKINIEVLDKAEPICYGGSNGFISIQGLGGIPPYSYHWSNGMTGAYLEGLQAGGYSVSIVDSRQCTQSFSIKLKAPNEFKISLGADIDTTVCLGQIVSYNFENTGYTYKWGSDTGFESTSPSVTFSEGGKYWLSVENEWGCSASDTIEVLYREAFFDADFLLPDEGVINTPIVMIDISWPVPDSISWSYDQTNIATQQSTEDQEVVVMSDPGVYAIGMAAYSGECFGILEKEIAIFSTPEQLTNESPEESSSCVLEFSLSPNPNNGTFEVNVLLEQQQVLELWVIGQDGIQFDHRELQSGFFFEEYYSFNALQPGIYTLVLQTDTEWQYLNFVVN
jgi:hypothetical protein